MEKEVTSNGTEEVTKAVEKDGRKKAR